MECNITIFLSQFPPDLETKKKAIDDTLTAYHAFTYEMLSKADIPNKNSDGTITIIRTERKNVTDMYNLKPGKTGKIKRGPLESTSLVEPVYVNGTTELTTQKVPIHRVFSTYFNEVKPGINKTPFLSDGENEFLAMLDGLEVKHISSKPKTPGMV